MHVRVKPGFHMSGKSQTMGDFTFCRLSQILPIYQIFVRGLSQIFEKRSRFSRFVPVHPRRSGISTISSFH